MTEPSSTIERNGNSLPPTRRGWRMRNSPLRCRSSIVSSGRRRSSSALPARSRRTGTSASARCNSSGNSGGPPPLPRSRRSCFASAIPNLILSPAYPALHEVSGPEMFESAAYRDRGGPASTGEWRALQTNWRRNLLEGVDNTPDVPPENYVLLLEGARGVVLPPGIEVRWLRGIGLDRTIEECGLAVLNDPAPVLDLARRDPRLRLYRPISEKIRAD